MKVIHWTDCEEKQNFYAASALSMMRKQRFERGVTTSTKKDVRSG